VVRTGGTYHAVSRPDGTRATADTYSVREKTGKTLPSASRTRSAGTPSPPDRLSRHKRHRKGRVHCYLVNTAPGHL
jgi:hypothetical protein